MLAYAFKGIGKFAVVMLPWHFSNAKTGVFTDENVYAMIILGLTSLYAIKGGMVSVVITEILPGSINHIGAGKAEWMYLILWTLHFGLSR
jgi:hypothetical protein